MSRGDWVDQPSTFVPSRYVEFVERAGGLAVLLPPRLDVTEKMATEVLSRLDALIIAGGADVEPSSYAAQPGPNAQPGRPDRDAWELALARTSRSTGTPLLGICRGMQIMAVADGGTLVQHLPDVVGHEEHSPHIGAYGEHLVRPLPGTRVAAILGEEERVVPTYHHQAVATHPGYVPAARHADGTLEAMVDEQAAYRLGVQWHPEAGQDLRLVEALLEVAGPH